MNHKLQRKRHYNNRSQPHTSPKVGGAADVLAGALHAPACFFVFIGTKSKMPPRPINNNKQTMRKLLLSP
jgi:hypothetical protein